MRYVLEIPSPAAAAAFLFLLLSAVTTRAGAQQPVRLLPLEDEVALALSAAPPDLRDGAGVWALQANGWVHVRTSSNGFTCAVNRDHPLARKPTCWDAEGTATILPVVRRWGELLLQGIGPDSIRKIIARGFKDGTYISPRRAGIAYMLSDSTEQYVYRTGRLAPFPPHVMFYAPNLTNEDIGFDGDFSTGLPFIAYRGPQAYMIMLASPAVSVAAWLKRRQADSARSARAAEGTGPCRDPAYRQFDFWIGDWNVANRQRRPQGTEWGITGQATDRVYPVAGGCGIVEHWRGTASPGEVLGYSLRAWNPDKQKWDLVLLWPRPEQPRFFTLEGTFDQGRGDFFRSVTDTAGNPVRIRFSFSDITANSLQWSDGTSRDGGNSWSSTWIMDFTRRDSLADPLLNGPTQQRDRCTFPEIHGMDAWLGEWRGEAILSPADTVPARAGSYEILDGCGQMDFVTLGDGEKAVKIYRVRTYQPGLKRWVEYRLDSRQGIIQRLEGSVEGSSALLESPSDNGDQRRVRTRWTRISGDSVEFETAAQSASGGWTTLWTVMLRPRGR